VVFVPYGEEEAMAEAVEDDAAAVIAEPIQGEGGINLPPEGYLEAVRSITGRAGAAMIVDEVQAGNGRTGEFWAVEHTNAIPDVVTTAKGLGNGLPIGAALCADWIAEDSGSHNSTFSGGPAVAAAVDVTVSNIVTRDLPAHAAEMGTYLTEEIEAAVGDSIREVRGEGLLLGVELAPPAWRFLDRTGLRDRALGLVVDPAVWLGVLFLATKLAVGVGAFTLLMTLLVPSLALVATPLYYDTPGVRVGVFLPADVTREVSLYVPWNELLVGVSFVVRLTSWQVTALPGALAMAALGVLALVLSLNVLNGVAWLCGRWAELLLGGALLDRPH